MEISSVLMMLNEDDAVMMHISIEHFIVDVVAMVAIHPGYLIRVMVALTLSTLNDELTVRVHVQIALHSIYNYNGKIMVQDVQEDVEVFIEDIVPVREDFEIDDVVKIGNIPATHAQVMAVSVQD